MSSRYNDPDIRDQARYVRSGRNKGVRQALRNARRAEAEDRNAATPAERRSTKTQPGAEA